MLVQDVFANQPNSECIMFAFLFPTPIAVFTFVISVGTQEGENVIEKIVLHVSVQACIHCGLNPALASGWLGSRLPSQLGYGFSSSSITKLSATKTKMNLIVTFPIPVAQSGAPEPCCERLWKPHFCLDDKVEGKRCCPY